MGKLTDLISRFAGKGDGVNDGTDIDTQARAVDEGDPTRTVVSDDPQTPTREVF